MKKIKNFSQFLNEGFFDNPVLGKLGSIFSGTEDSSYSTSAPQASSDLTSPLRDPLIPAGKSIAIGDSFVPYVAKGAGIDQGPQAKDIKNSRKDGLWFGGIAVGSLLTFSKDYKNIDNSIKNVVISIGSNGIYTRSTKTIKDLMIRLKVLFPNAKILVVKGVYGSKLAGYPQVQTVSQSTVDSFYSDFTANGATVIPTPVGNIPNGHGHLPVYKIIGGEIKTRLKA